MLPNNSEISFTHEFKNIYLVTSDTIYVSMNNKIAQHED